MLQIQNYREGARERAFAGARKTYDGNAVVAGGHLLGGNSIVRGPQSFKIFRCLSFGSAAIVVVQAQSLNPLDFHSWWGLVSTHRIASFGDRAIPLFRNWKRLA